MPIRELMTEDTAREILRSIADTREAQLFRNKTNSPFSVQKLVIPLTTARNENDPYKINIPFKSFYVQDATDVNTTVNVRVMSQDTYQSSFTVRKNDSFDADDMFDEIILDWSAQSGKTITIILFTSASFRSGSQISITGGGLVINEGTSFVDTNPTLSATTATLVFSQDSTRALGVIQNLTGASIWVGASTVVDTGANRGREVPAGDYFEWKNTAALYAYSVLGGSIFVRTQN